MIKKYFCTVRSVQGAHKYISDQLKKNAFSTFYASNSFPKKVRNQFNLLQWFNFQLGTIKQNTSQINIAMAKICFWQTSINKIYKKQIVDPQPVSIALEYAVKNNPLSKQYFDKFIDGWSNTFQPFLSLTSMSQACQYTFYNYLMLHHQLLRNDLKNPDLIKATRLIARAMGISFIIKRIPLTLRKGWLTVPIELQNKHNFNIKNLWDRRLGKPKQQLYDAILQMASFARQNLIEASLIKLDKNQSTGLVLAIQIQYFLQLLQKCEFNVFRNYLHANSYFQLPLRIKKLNTEGKFLKQFD